MPRTRHPVDPTRETCEPVPMTADGILIRAAGAPVKGLKQMPREIERVVVDMALKPKLGPPPPHQYGRE